MRCGAALLIACYSSSAFSSFGQHSILRRIQGWGGLTIIMSQLPNLFGVAAAGTIFDRAISVCRSKSEMSSAHTDHWSNCDAALLLGERFLPGRAGR